MIAVMTAAPRAENVQARAICSVIDAGFKLKICAEPDTHGLFVIMLSESDLSRWTRRYLHRQGQWHNFLNALLFGIRHGDQHFITCEDDILCTRHLAEAAHALPWPSENCGVVQLYTSAGYRDYFTGLQKLREDDAMDMLGACCLLWDRKAAIDVLKWGNEKGWRGDSHDTIDDPVEKKAADTFVGEVLTHLGYEIWIHTPTLVEHIGTESSLGHKVTDPKLFDPKRRQGADFPGEDADAREVCSWWHSTKPSTVTSGSTQA